MESGLTRPPKTPPRARSVGPTRPHRDSMEDTDSSGTRKRPRLDSGDRTYRSMSADRLGDTTTDSGLSKAVSTPSNRQASSPPSMAAPIVPPMNPTPSKVTINVREPVNPSPTISPTHPNAASSLRGGVGGSDPGTGYHGFPGKMDSQSPNVISVGSSPSQSPEIEVAEVEDMTDEPSETRWKSYDHADRILKATRTHRTLMNNFPYKSAHVTLRKTLVQIAKAFEKGDLDDGDVFIRLADWIKMYLQETESFKVQWIEMYLEERGFWDDFPMLPETLSHRNTIVGGSRSYYSANDGVFTEESPLQSFLVTYAFLAMRMVQIDLQTLSGHLDVSDTPQLISDRYLQGLAGLVDPETQLGKSSNHGFAATGAAITRRFILPPLDGLACLKHLSQGILERCQQSPGLIPRVFACINLANGIMYHYSQSQKSDTDVDEVLLSPITNAPSQAYELFSAIDEYFQMFISKQVPALSIEMNQSLVHRLSLLLRRIADSDEQLTPDFVSKQLTLVQDVSDSKAALVETAWKFETLKRCILEGRMEIRVHGVSQMDTELVYVYNQHIRQDPAGKDHPLPQYLSNFLLANKLVDYFVGVESHPQLISRCANVIGFLVVTHKYTEAESDVIWRAVTTSQDSRFVEALLNMLQGIFSIADSSTLLYLVTKLNEMPIHAFDGPMIQFARTLLLQLRQKWKFILSEQNVPVDQKMDMPPFDLCIRLIRQSVAESSLEPQRTREIHHFAVCELGHLLPFGPTESDRRAIYDKCLHDIAGRTEFATGSISAINALLAQDHEREIALICKDANLTPLLVGEFAHMIQSEQSLHYPTQMIDERLSVRLQLLQDIIMRVPDTIDAHSSTQLWDYAVGPEALHDPARENAWMCFIRAMRWPGNGSTRNTFIDQCIRDHLPRLDPRFYTPGCLQFVQDAVHYHSRMTALRPELDAKQDSPAGALLWQLSLTAPPHTIEDRAICLLVAYYLDSPDVQRRSRAATEAVHIEVVERCMHQLTSAASKLKAFSDGTSSGEDEPMVIVASEEEVQLHRLSFSRSLMILKEFVRGVRARPRYSPQPQTLRQLPYETPDNKGPLIKVRYQAFGGVASSDIRTVEVGVLETIQEFSRRLSSLTGFTKLNLIAGGQRLDLTNLPTQTLQDLRLDQKGLLLVKRVADAEASPGLGSPSVLRPVENEILSHFPDLYQLLSLEDSLGKELFEFLRSFEPHASITTLVYSKDASYEAVFPSTAPYKTRYSIYAFRKTLEHRSQNSLPTRDLVHHGIRSMTAALATLNLTLDPQGPDVDMLIALDMVDCVGLYLKEPKSDEGIESLFADPLALVNRLNVLTTEAVKFVENDDAGKLASASFSVLLQISQLSEVLWALFKDRVAFSSLLQRCLLEEPRSQIRGQIAASIKGIRGISKTSQTIPARELVPYLWGSLVQIIPFCLEFADSSEQFFSVVDDICNSMDRASCEALDLSIYLQTWSDILLQHVHYEFVGSEMIDWIVIGLSRLVKWCYAKARELGKGVQISDDFLERLYKAHLFPQLPDADDDVLTETRIPNLYAQTRKELYDIILVMSNDLVKYQKLLLLVKDLLCQGYDFEPNFNFERSKCLRSGLGYPGLRNLSNTCYMNSLFTQLFMNVKFRAFMLGTNVADGNASQRLLQETQNLFGFMQESMTKSVDPQGIVDSLVTYDNSLIDVSVQMDVDEFYNLLFDRWESQILSEADKKKFRAFYGGQIVQQIKSKECDHISEKLEPFSAIQCDILGKMSLADSLHAYVTGEVMEGDNKYACTSCGRYVDAVKRACFKDIPDNVIFHLKRFDYDVMTGMRNKINELFEFPDQVDMAPYHVDHLKDPQQQPKPDWFQLVGMLVHSGSAESGHYYSYIKERPPIATSSTRWVEFNDTEVTEFNPATIADNCFGGFSDPAPYAARYQKAWNAYMLFYERMDPHNVEPDNRISNPRSVPAKCAMPSDIEQRVALENAKWLRYYCLFGQQHADFARQLLEQLRIVKNGICSDDHRTEQVAITLSLDYLQLILARSKDSSGFISMLTSLHKVIGACSVCCKLALDWVVDHESALRNMLFRCIVPKVRKDFCSMILVALKHLQRYDEELYGIREMEGVDGKTSKMELPQGSIFWEIVDRLKGLMNLVLQQPRGWDDYFGLLADLANLGIPETNVLLNLGFLHHCLEILVVEHPRSATIRMENPHLAHYYRLCEKGRKFSINRLTELIAVLLTRVDLQASPVTRLSDRRLFADGMRLTKREDTYLYIGCEYLGSKSRCFFLQRLLDAASTKEAMQAIRKIVQVMTLAAPELELLTPIQNTIIYGVNVEPANAAAPFLRAAIAFCECTPTESSAETVIRHIAKEVDTIGFSGGREHLDFFLAIRMLRSLRPNISPNFFSTCVLHTAPMWAPTLLMYWDDNIRNQTYDLLKRLVFGQDVKNMDDEEQADRIYAIGRDLQMACLRRCDIRVQEQKTIDARSVEQIVSVIKFCLDNYYGDDDQDRRAQAEAECILSSLEALTVSDVDEAASDTWNNASDEPTDSDSDYPATSP